MKSNKMLWLSAIALASLGLYLWLAVRYPLSASLTQPRAAWSTMVSATNLNAAQHVLVYFGLTLLYIAVMRLLLPTPGGIKTNPQAQIIVILVAWLACSGVLLLVGPGGESHDIFDYLFRGRMMTVYHANPLVEIPEDYGTAPYNRYIAWRKYVDTYGPLWETSGAAISHSVRQITQWLGWWDEDQEVCPRSPESCRLLMVYITAYRSLAISLTGLSGWLIYKMVKRSQANLAPLALAAWLLSPMTLIASAVGGHNDALMLVLVLLSWWLLQREQPFWAFLALILAAHVKLTALIWLPVCGLWIVRRWGWRSALKSGLASAAVGLALSWWLYAPFGGWQTLPRMLHERSLFMAKSPWQIVKYLLVNHWNWPRVASQQLSVRLANGIFTIGAVVIPMWMFNFRPKRWRRSRIDSDWPDRTLWRALAAVSLLFLLIGSFWFQHWYVLWVLAPAVLLPDKKLCLTILPWLVFGALASNAALDFLMATALKTSPPITTYILDVIIIWAHPALAIFVSWLAWRRDRKALPTEMSFIRQVL